MTILEIQNLAPISNFSNFAPFIFKSMPGRLELADWWEGPDYSRDYNLFIQGFIRDISFQYILTSSYNEMVIQEGSFFWDNAEQILYIHFEHDQEGWTANYEYGSFSGYTDQKLLDLDGQEYLPLMTNTINIPQQQDIINYPKLSFISASVTLTNVQGINDDIINGNIYGNTAQLYYADNPQTRADLIPLASLWVEDYDISVEEITIRLQDRRKQDNITIPRERFPEGDVIPLLYGQVREAKAINTGTVNYRVALLLTSLGTVQANIDDVWTTKIPVVTDLTNGSFTLDAEYNEVKVVNPIGIAITKLTDVIKDLYDRFLNISYVGSLFDTTEFDSESTEILSGGLLLDTEQEFFEAIRKIQNGANRGFRFEINGNGLRTIRLDKNDRASTCFIAPEDIKNRNKIKVSTDSDLIYSEISVAYGKSYQSGRFLRVLDDTYRQQVLERYRNQKRLAVETLLLTETDALDRASYDADRFKDVPRTVELELFGFMELRLLDMCNVMLTPDWANLDTGEIRGREFFGFKKCKVVGVNPNFTKGINSVRMQIIEDVKIFLPYMVFSAGSMDLLSPSFFAGSTPAGIENTKIFKEIMKTYPGTNDIMNPIFIKGVTPSGIY